MQRRAEVGGIHEVSIPGYRSHRDPPLRRPAMGRPVTGPRAAALALLIGAMSMLGCRHGDAGAAAAGPAPIPNPTILGGLGETPGRFGYPRALDADATSLWVIDKTARVQRLDPKTGACLLWWRMPEFALGKPVGICVVSSPGGGGGDDTIYIPDTHYNRVMVYRPPARSGDPPTLVRSFGSYGKDPGQFIYPTDVAVITSTDRSKPDRIYVSEYGGNDRICAFDLAADGDPKFLFSFGAFGSSTDPAQIEFNRPQSIAIARDAKGDPTELVVTDSRNHRLGRFTLDGKLIAWIGSADTPGDALGQFRYPYGIALLGDGTALISEYGNNRVQQVDLASGRGLQVWGRPGRGDGDLATPWAITVLGDRTFVLDTGNNRLVSFPTPKPASHS